MQTLERGTDEEGQPLTSDDYAEHSRNISDLKPLLDAYDKYVKYEDEINELDDLVDECEDDKELRALAIEDKQKLHRQFSDITEEHEKLKNEHVNLNKFSKALQGDLT